MNRIATMAIAGLRRGLGGRRDRVTARLPDADLTGGVVYRCTLAGDCRREVTSTKPIVLGTQAS